MGERDERVTIKRSGGFDRFLVPAGPHAFHPVGTPGVRVVFAVGEGPASAVTVYDGPLVVTGKRMPAAAGVGR